MKWQLGFVVLTIALAAGSVGHECAVADPWADHVASYVQGSNPDAGYTDPTSAIGEPERFTGELGGYPGAVTPFSAPWGTDEVVSIGEGGELVVHFDEPVMDDPANPFGIDLLIFGNAFFNLDFNTSLATGGVASEGGIIAVSRDGTTYVTVPDVDADGAFPSLGYADVTEPFPSNRGSMPTDFTRPVNPTFDPTGLHVAQIAAAYDGSGGGVGVDLATVGLSAISYVRIRNPSGSGVTPDIDAFADVRAVPEPAAWMLVWLLSVGFLARIFHPMVVSLACAF